MSAKGAEDYHSAQIEVFEGTAADMVAAITMNYVEEALGITRAARRTGMPVAIAFTVETDGRLPTGQALRAAIEQAIEQVEAETSSYPSYDMINCAHKRISRMCSLPINCGRKEFGDCGRTLRARVTPS
jgi:homocysteine S-methyltransferase